MFNCKSFTEKASVGNEGPFLQKVESNIAFLRTKHMRFLLFSVIKSDGTELD